MRNDGEVFVNELKREVVDEYGEEEEEEDEDDDDAEEVESVNEEVVDQRGLVLQIANRCLAIKLVNIVVAVFRQLLKKK